MGFAGADPIRHSEIFAWSEINRFPRGRLEELARLILALDRVLLDDARSREKAGEHGSAEPSDQHDRGAGCRRAVE